MIQCSGSCVLPSGPFYYDWKTFKSGADVISAEAFSRSIKT